MSADLNLLAGLLAVKLDFASRDDLVAATRAWQADKTRPLADLLPLSPDRRLLLDALVAEQLKGKDVPQALAEMSSVDWVRDAFKEVQDPDIERTINFIPAPVDGTVQQVGASPTVRAQSPRAGSRFRIIRPHARGGLGEVYVAEDTELSREVALKEIQPQHAGNENTRGRFMLEAEVTGGLEHPNIVPVYGLGTYGDGRPYYAMRFIRGDSLKDAIERFYAPQSTAAPAERNLEFRNLLKRFVDVCNAIAYAHSRGILHRDLKPGNIMLGKYGETLVVDWGLAKALSDGTPEPHDAESATPAERHLVPASGSYAETQAGSIVGTPAFMSPEQAAAKFEELGPAADVYSLGATLYVILTGQVPFTGGIAELLVNVAAGKFPSPRSVKPETPASLNAVVMKAMAKDPKDRYSTATELAQEIERYLADEPVLAIREPFRVRARRWARKHPGTVAGLSATVLVGLIGSGIAALLVSGKNRELDSKNNELAASNDHLVVARNDAEAKRQQAETARDRARQRTQLALDAFNDMVMSIQTKLETRPATQDLRKSLLDKARQGLLVVMRDDTEKQGNPDSTYVWSFLRLGDLHLMLGDTASAQAEFNRGHDLARKIAENVPVQEQSLIDLDVCYDRLGDVTFKVGKTKDAFDWYAKALPNRQRRGIEQPANTEAQRDLSVTYERLGTVAMRLGRLQEALDCYRKLHTITQQRCKTDPDSVLCKNDLSVSLGKLGDVTLEMGQTTEAYNYFLEQLKGNQLLADRDTQNVIAQRDLSICYERLGEVSRIMGHHQKALEWHKKMLPIRQRLAEEDSKNFQAQRDLNICYEKLGDRSMQLNRLPEAKDWFEKVLEISLRLARSDPRDVRAQRDLSVGYEKLGDVMRLSNQLHVALDHYESGKRIREQLLLLDPTDVKSRRDLSLSHERLGLALMKMGRIQESVKSFTRMNDLKKLIVEANPKNPLSQRELSVSYSQLGAATLKSGDAPKAFELYQQSLAIDLRLAEEDPTNYIAQTDLFVSFHLLGRFSKRNFEYVKAIEYYGKARAVLLPWHERKQIEGEFKNAIPVLDREIEACKNAERTVADINFAFTQSSEQIPQLLRMRLDAMLSRKAFDDAKTTARRYADWADQQKVDRDALCYDTACNYALCAAACPSGQEAMLSSALDHLERLKGRGYFSSERTAHFFQDSDFHAIRQRPAFVAFVNKLKSTREQAPFPRKT